MAVAVRRNSQPYPAGRNPEIFEQVVHRRVLPPAVLEREKLIVEIAGRFSGETRKVDVAGTLALFAVARGARLHAGRHRIWWLAGTLSKNGKSLDEKPPR